MATPEDSIAAPPTLLPTADFRLGRVRVRLKITAPLFLAQMVAGSVAALASVRLYGPLFDPSFRPPAYGWLSVVICTAVQIACVIAHELGHAVMANRLGVRTHWVEVRGFSASVRRDPTTAGRAALIAAAGPVAHFAAAIVGTQLVGALSAGPHPLLSAAGVGCVLSLVWAIPWPITPGSDGGKLLRLALHGMRVLRARRPSLAA